MFFYGVIPENIFTTYVFFQTNASCYCIVHVKCGVMKKIILTAVICFPGVLQAQSSISSDIVEGGKALIELFKVIRTPRVQTAATLYDNGDSCGSKRLADIRFKNKTDKSVVVSLFLRVGNAYDAKPLILTLAALSQESLYELKAGVYKYKIETEIEGKKVVLHEGELKLQPCDKAIKEIKASKENN